MDKRVNVVVYYLRGRLDAWWRSVQCIGGEPTGYGPFLEALLSHFYPNHFLMKKYKEFMTLQ